MRWSQLRGIGQTAIFRLIIIAPLFGHLVLFSDDLNGSKFVRELLQLPTGSLLGDAVAQAPQSDGSTWATKVDWLRSHATMLSTYFSLVLLGVGSILFQIRCPNLIAQSRDFFEFHARSLESSTTLFSVGLLRELDGMGIRKMPSYGKDLELILTSVNLIRSDFDHVDDLVSKLRDISHSGKADIAKLYYDVVDNSRGFIRAVITILFGVGFALSLVPSLTVLIQVTRALWDQSA